MTKTQILNITNRLVGYKLTHLRFIGEIKLRRYLLTCGSVNNHVVNNGYNQSCSQIHTTLQKYPFSTSYSANNHVTNSYRRSDLSGKAKPDLNSVAYDFKPEDNTQKKRHLKPHELRMKSVPKPSTLPPKRGPIPNNSSQVLINKEELFEPFEQFNLSTNEAKFRDGIEFSTKGTYKDDMEGFYKDYFRDRDRKIDGMRSYLETNNDLSEAPIRPLKARINPQRYWYNEDYRSPSAKEIALMPSRKVKFTMMQEVHEFRKNGNYSSEVWIAVKKRTTKMLRRVDLRTLLRFLYCYASIKLEPDYYIKELIIAISERKSMMKPKHHIFYFQALSRLNWRDINLTKFLNEMSLCWPILRNNFLIKASNSLAKLGMGSDPLCKPLIYTLNHRITTFTGKNCYLLKWIAVVELFDSEMIIKYLDQCEMHKITFKSYSRNIQVVEIFLRLLRPDIYHKLPQKTRAFLELSRKSNTIRIHQDKISTKQKKENGSEGTLNWQPAIEGETPPHSHFSEGLDWSSFLAATDIDLNKNNENLELCNIEFEDRHDDEDPNYFIQNKHWSSDLHREISDSLWELNINHLNSVSAGPFLIDIYLPMGNFVIEAISDYQFYSETSRLTSQAIRRREIISAMGFKIITVSHFNWSPLKNTAERKSYLLSILPEILLPGRKYY